MIHTEYVDFLFCRSVLKQVDLRAYSELTANDHPIHCLFVFSPFRSITCSAYFTFPFRRFLSQWNEALLIFLFIVLKISLCDHFRTNI